MHVARWTMITVLLSTVAAVAEAQTCEGQPAFSSGGKVARAGVTVTDRMHRFGVGFGTGKTNGVYSGISFGTKWYDTYDHGSSYDVSSSLGYQVSLNRANAVQLCPVGRFGYGSGPKDLRGTRIDASQWALGFGVRMGARVPAGRRVTVAPNGGLEFGYSKAKFQDGSGGSLSKSDSYGILGLGLGLVINSRVAITPGISIPLGLDEGDPAYGIGKGRPAYGIGAAVSFGPPR